MEVNLNDELQVIVSEDDPSWSPRWAAAMLALRGSEKNVSGDRATQTYDVKPLAEALASGETVPREVLDVLATMLDPHPEWRGPRLVIHSPKHETNRAFAELLALKREIRDEYKSGVEKGSGKKKLIWELGEKYSVKRTFILESLKITDMDVVKESTRLLGKRITGVAVLPKGDI